jgi:hypothetical protein
LNDTERAILSLRVLMSRIWSTTTRLETAEISHGRSPDTLEFGCLKHFKWYFKLDSESDHIYCAVYQYVCACLLQ